jgi:hypothetical protein
LALTIGSACARAARGLAVTAIAHAAAIREVNRMGEELDEER